MKFTSFAKTIILFVILSTNIDMVTLQNKRSKEPIKIHAIDYQSLISKAELIYSKPVKLSECYQATSVERLGRSYEALQNALCQSISPVPGDEAIIWIFPACPEEWDAQFQLLCRGNFLVSSSYRNQKMKLFL